MSRGEFVDINEKIKKRRLELGLTMLEVAKMAGVSEATVSRWESGDIANMRRDKIVLLSNALQVPAAFIMDTDAEPNYEQLKKDGLEPYNPKVRKIPVLGYVAAGLPIFADENIIDYTYTDILDDGYEYFALKVKGDSMNAAQINDGNIVIVRVQSMVDNGEIAVVRVDNENATVKKFNRIGNTVQLIPQSLNPIHQIQEYNLKNTKIDIVGKVVECKIKF